MSRFFPTPPTPDNPIQFPYVSKVKVKNAESNPVIQSLTQADSVYFRDFNEEHITDKKIKPLTKY
jgi:glutathione peroxidase-family protein